MVDPLDERDDNLEIPDSAESVDGETFAEWADEHAETVKHVLSEMTAVYANDGHKRPIKNASISHVRPDAEYVGVQFDLPAEVDPDVTGANIIRLLDDLNSHEMSHKNWSDLHSKKDVAKSYAGFGRLAGQIQNIVEDEYIDARRKVRWKGLREKLAYYVWLHMNTESRAPPADTVYDEEGLENAMMNALLQTALAGYVNGIEDAPDEIAECMARIEPLFDKARALAVRDEKTDTPGRETAAERATITHTIMSILLRYLPDPTEVDEDKMDKRSRDTSAQEDPAESPPSFGEDGEMELSDEMEDTVEDLMQEMVEDDDIPDPIPDAEDADGDGLEIEVEVDADKMGDAIQDEASDETETETESDAESDPVDAGSDPEDPGGSTDKDGMDETSTEAGDGDSGESEITRDLAALVDEYGSENLVVDG